MARGFGTYLLAAAMALLAVACGTEHPTPVPGPAMSGEATAVEMAPPPASEFHGTSERLPAPVESRRYALVFGNGAYRHGDALPAPPRDAALMARALQSRGYHVLLGIDRDLAGMREDIASFEAMSRDAGLRLFYFAGHGFEFDSANYLMPVDLPVNIAELDRQAVRRNALRLDQVTWRLGQDVPLLVAVVDACRVLPARGTTSAFSFVAEEPPEGSIIAFATAPGKVAMDSLRAYGVDEDHSPYSYYLANALLSPEVRTWDQAFLAASAIVDNQTRGQQQPWMNARVNRFPAIGQAATAAAATPANMLGISVSPERRAAGRYWAGEALAAQRLAADGSRPDDVLRRQSREGDARATIALATRLDRDGAPVAQVAALLEPLAEAGNAVAQVDLGTVLYAARASDSEGRTARHWWTLASAQGIGEARAKLAILDGNGSVQALREFMQGVAEEAAAFAPGEEDMP